MDVAFEAVGEAIALESHVSAKGFSPSFGGVGVEEEATPSALAQGGEIVERGRV